MTTAAAREEEAYPRPPAEKAVWSVLVWGLFLVFVLGPLLTVLAFSLTPNIFEGVHPTTLRHYARLFSDAQLYGPLIRSFEVAFIVVVIQLFLGTLIAYSTVRGRVVGAKLLDAMTNITVALPSVVVGLALLAFYGPFGPANAFAEFAFDRPFTLTWTLAILVLAHVLETFPYMVRSVTTALLRMDPYPESAARSLGANRWVVFRTVTLPQLRPSLVAGSVLVLSRSIAEFGATIIVVSAVLRTAPVKIYSEAEAGSLELAAAYSVVLMLVSFGTYLAMTRWLLKEEDMATA